MDLGDEHFRYVPKEVTVNISRYLSQTDINNLIQTCCQFYEHLRLELYRRNARESRSSALLWAALHDNSAMAKLCLLAGASHGIVRVKVGDPLLPGNDVLNHYEAWCRSFDRHTRYEITPLWVATAHGNEDVARVLIEGGADLNLCGPLSAAACRGNEAIVSLLLSYQVDLEDAVESGATALQVAVYKQHETIVRLLLEGGADANHQNNWENDDPSSEPDTLLVHAAEASRNESITRLLIDHGAGIDIQTFEGGSILEVVCRNKWPEIIRLLIAKGADPDSSRDPSSRSLLARAAYGGDTTCCQALIQGGANIEPASKADGAAPLVLAAIKGHYDIVKLLVQGGANLETSDNDHMTSLIHAAKRSHWDVVELLLEFGAKAESFDGNSRRALHYAVREGSTRHVALLLEHGAPVNAFDGNGLTALHAAVLKRSLSSVRLLLKHGADVEAVAAGRKTALVRACVTGQVEIVRELLRHGASVEKKEGQALSPLGAAAHAQHVDVVRECLASGTSLDKARESEALVRACVHDNVQIATMLLEAGADPGSSDGPGGISVTPLWKAVYHGNEDVARLLLDWGAQVAEEQLEWTGFSESGNHEIESKSLLSLAKKHQHLGIYIQLESAVKATLFDRMSDDEFPQEMDDGKDNEYNTDDYEMDEMVEKIDDETEDDDMMKEDDDTW